MGQFEFSQALNLLIGTPLVPAAIIGLIWGIIGGALPGISAETRIGLISIILPQLLLSGSLGCGTSQHLKF